MNGLIPKRSCVNPVLITTFGLEPPGTKRDEGEGAPAVERSDRRGLGKPFPNQTEGAVWAQKNEGEGAVAVERSDRRGLGKPFPNQ